MIPRVLSPRDTVQRYPVLGCTGTLANWRTQKRGPKFYKMSRKVFYRPEDIEAFLFRSPVLTKDSMR